MNKTEFDDFLKTIITDCGGKNILIIIDSRFEPKILPTVQKKEVYELFNDHFLTASTSDDLFSNITLINLTNTNRKVLYFYKNKNNYEIFRKNVNIIPFDTNIFINEDFSFNGIIKNTDFIKQVNVTEPDIKKDCKYYVSYPTLTPLKGGNKHQYVNFRLMNIENIPKDSTKLVDQWWFKWYFFVPPCLSNRLMQKSGTCWMNSVINSLFFVPEISTLLIKKYNELPLEKKNIINPITYKNIVSCTHDLNTLLFSLVNNLLITKKKAQIGDGDFIGCISSKVKCKYENKPTECANIKYGDSGGKTFTPPKI
jgi:hypothetical protein